jgi:hypothetical protein
MAQLADFFSLISAGVSRARLNGESVFDARTGWERGQLLHLRLQRGRPSPRANSGVRAVSCRRVVPVQQPPRFSRKMPAHLQAVESLELNPAHLFSKPVGSSLIFYEPAVRFHFIVEVPVH